MAQRLGQHFGRLVIVALASAWFVSVTAAQDFATKAPTAAEWEAIAKLPDFSGVWEMPLGDASLIVPPGSAKQNAPKAASTSGRPASIKQPSLPLTPTWVAKMKYLKAHPPQDNPQANCVPNGMPEIMRLPYPYEFLITPGQVTIIGELYRMIRHIYTDGRPLPKDPAPTFWGASVGHWEGQTLVAETVGLLPQTNVIPGSGIEQRIPHSDKMKVFERFRLLDPNTMQIKTTIIDPVVFTRPYTTTRILKRHPTWTIDEYICEQNNRNAVTSSGKAEVDTTPPPPSGPDPNLK
ncbi:MAG: hypothetical protein ACRD5K_08520 [Candidatus Acidiferrales bacterium]